MDVKLPDGKIIRGVPEGTTKAQLAQKLQANGITVPQEWMGTTGPTAQKETISGDLAQAAKNIPQSAVNVGTSYATAIRHPIDTGKGLINIAAGALQRALEPESWKKSGNPFLHSPEAKKAFDATTDHFKNRYGSLEKAKQAFIQDPVGVAMDLSMVAGFSGSMAKLAGLSKTANTLTKVSNLTDPVRQTARLARGVVRPAYTYTVGLTTGSGAEAIKEALKGGDAFTQAMRGKISETDVLDTARGALQTIKEDRAAAYQSKLSSLKANKQVLNIDDIKAASEKWLGQYNITKTKDGLDFSRSTLRNNPSAANEVKTVYENLQDWGSRPGDLTPSGLDILKQQIADTYTTNSRSRAMVADLSNKVKSKIVKAVPEYAEMTKDYAKASDLIDDLNKGLGLSDRTATDTALRKLLTAFREDKTFRRNLINTLSEKSGEDIAGAVSGLLMKNPWSNRMSTHITSGVGIGGIAFGHPATGIPLLLSSSPRFMGEVTRGIGKAAQAVPKNKAFYMLPYQAGRLPGLRDDNSL